MKRFLERTLKGVGIGIAMIIPGVSGGTLAVLLKIYDDIINAINGIFKHFKKSLLILIPVLLGAIIGFAGLVFPLQYGLKKIPFVVITLFAGFIIGGIPSLYKKVKGKENPIGIIVCLVSIAFMIGICFLTSQLNFDVSKMTAGLWFYLFFAGVVVAITLVIPGISGSTMMMCMGLYYSLLDIISQLMQFKNILGGLNILLPVILGAIIGFFIVSYVMAKLLKNHETNTYFSIIGFIVGSIFAIYYLGIKSDKYPITFNALQISLAVVALILGFVFSFFLEKALEKKQEKEELEASKEVVENETR